MYLTIFYMCSNKGMLYKVAAVLTVVGGLNWGLVAFFDFDLVQFLVGSFEMMPDIVYGLVGLSALYLTISCFTCKD